jgi:hypothetical protein
MTALHPNDPLPPPPELSSPEAPPAEKKPLVDWGFACGRHYLTVAGYIVAMEGDPIRDADVFALQGDAARKLGWKGWDGEAIKAVCAAANKEKL